MVAGPNNFPLLKELLADQQRLDTPVARFAAFKDDRAGRSYRDLIPLSSPQPGEQYAFEVDLDSCSGCKACVSACHSLNGLDDTEAWRDVGLLVGGDHRRAVQQTITSACHHCADPACMNGCPVLAYEKDPVTGIVRHLDDQCIGCQYCVLKCPYDVPKYNSRLGIVRKCDLCHSRLAEGEAPACVQACPTTAIRIVTVKFADTSRFLAAAPEPGYTKPATRYLSARALPADLVAADAAALRPQPAHWPLAAMTVLMAMAVGCGVADKALSLATPAIALLGWAAGAAGLGVSVLHLGQPLRAWKVFLGLRRSWLSREAVVFGLWFPAATAYAAVRLDLLPLAAGPARSALAVGTVLLGGAGLCCSAMVYVDTRRRFWRAGQSFPRFLGTAVILGLACALVAPGAPPWLGLVLAAASLLKLGFESRALAPLSAGNDAAATPERQTALLLSRGEWLRPINEARVVAALAGGVLLPLMVALGRGGTVAAATALACCLLGELAERHLFFRAVDAPKMPGVPA